MDVATLGEPCSATRAGVVGGMGDLQYLRLQQLLVLHLLWVR